MQRIVVQKFGGSSVADAEKLHEGLMKSAGFMAKTN